MGSRLRENPDHLFICFCEVVVPTNSETQPWIIQKYPENFNDEEILKSVPEFACPCDFPNDAVRHFSFVLTSLDSKWTYGFCRHAPNQATLLCFLSCLPWHKTFYSLLNEVADLTNDPQLGSSLTFLDMLYNNPVPEPGSELSLAHNSKLLLVRCLNHLGLPTIPENINLTEYINAVNVHNMIVVLASLLHERRILITSRRLSRLCACVEAANYLIYPMYWQHIFIPVLPKHLLDYVSAPMPFLIGVPAKTMMKINTSELNEVVILNVDTNTVRTPFKDFEALPSEVVSSLKRRLKSPNVLLGDAVARAFLRNMVRLIGGYREALEMKIGERITFNKEAFIKTRPPSIQPFLETMLHLQIFHQFIEDRLEMLNSGVGFSDVFEEEANLFVNSSSDWSKVQYSEWVRTMRKEGGLFIKNVGSKVKDKGKKAYKDLRSKIQKNHSHADLTRKISGGGDVKTKSAPSSPTFSHSNAFEPRKSYIPKEANKHRDLGAPNLPNSMSVPGIRRYKVLTIDEMSNASDESASDTEVQLLSEPLSMDLMGGTQDLIFKPSPPSSDIVNTNTALTFNANHSNKTITQGSNLAFDDTFSGFNGIEPTRPIPPVRTKNKLKMQALQQQQQGKNKTSQQDLIVLDDDSLFDPCKQLNSTPSDFSLLAPSKTESNLSDLKEKIQLFNKQPQNSTFSTLQPDEICRLSHNSQSSMKCFLQHLPNPVNTPVQNNIRRPDTRPPIPPKTRQSYLTKDDKSLLDEYGLSDLPIFKSCVIDDAGSSASPRADLKFDDDFANLYQNDNKKSQNQTSWQKFI